MGIPQGQTPIIRLNKVHFLDDLGRDVRLWTEEDIADAARHFYRT